jgi:flagellar motor switch protein FliN/FliY
MSEDAEKAAISADDWAAAMAEQETAAQPAAEDDWAAAMAEQAAAEGETGAAPAPQKAQIFQSISAGAAQPAANNLDLILDIPVQMTVELGRTKITIRNLLQLAQGSVVELDGLAGEPMDVLVNGCLIAQGEVVVVNDKFGIRLTDIISPAERLRRINK